jgi:hypothetical protein
MPYANTEAMTEHLEEISSEVAPGAHAILLCDGAGWHQRGGRLLIPDNITRERDEQPTFPFLIEVVRYAPLSTGAKRNGWRSH